MPGDGESVLPVNSNDSELVSTLVDESEKMFQQLHVEDESSGDFENLFEKFQEMRGK